jgi:hypothetical protein
MMGSGPSVLAPFSLDERIRKLVAYWQVVLPGSKRLVRDNEMVGDNSDVRPPHGTGGGGFIRFSTFSRRLRKSLLMARPHAWPLTPLGAA